MLIPSLSDLFFLAILIWLFASGSYGWQGLLADGDAGWHIRTGEYILDHHAVPHQDLYSFSKPGAPWYAWEWGSDVFYAALHRLAALKGVVLAAAVLISWFAVTLLRRMAAMGVHMFVGLVMALLCVGSSSVHFLARPHVFTLVLLSVSVWMIERDRENPSPAIWLLAPITVLWTNLHGGFLALIAVLGLTAIGYAAEAWLAGDLAARWRPAARYGALAAVCLASSLINPYGYKLHQHMAEYLRSDWIKTAIQEFQSPSFRNESMMQFEVLLIVGLIAAAFLIRRRRLVETLWIVFFAHEALASIRHVPIFATVVGPVIAFEVSQWWTAWIAGAPKGSLRAIARQMGRDFAPSFRRTSMWPAVTVGGLALIGAPIPWPKDFPDAVFPVEIVHSHAAEILNARVLTTDQWADYLIYTNPRQKVFVDGRSDFYGPEIGNQYLRLEYGDADWARTMAQYRFDMALLPSNLGIVQLLKLQPDWRIVADDGKRILLAHTTAPVLSPANPQPERRF